MSDFQNMLSEINLKQAIELWVAYFKKLNHYKMMGDRFKISYFQQEISDEIQKNPLPVKRINTSNGSPKEIIESCFFMDSTQTWMGFVKFKNDGTPDLKNSFYVWVSVFLNRMRNGRLNRVGAIEEQWDKDRFSWSLPSINFTPLVLEGLIDKSLPFMNWSQEPFSQK